MFNLPWFMDPTFRVPMEYCSYSIGFYFITRHIHSWVSFLLWPSIFILPRAISLLFPSSILDTYQHWGAHPSGVISFCLFILFMGFSRQEYWSGLPSSSPVDHILSELSTMTHASWVALHHMALLSYTRLWSMWWLDFCDCGLHSEVVGL